MMSAIGQEPSPDPRTGRSSAGLASQPLARAYPLP
jgi:hypothetical protein